MLYKILVNGVTCQAFLSEEQACQEIVRAHRSGLCWDARVQDGSGSRTRLLNNREAETLISAVTERIHKG